MKCSQGTGHGQSGFGERGGARLNFLIVIALIAVVGYSLYQYAPVAYHAYLFKDYMQETINRAAYPPGQTTTWVESQLRQSASEYQLPPDAVITAQNVDGRLEARVQWTRPITLPGFVYQDKFDHTAKSSGFIGSK
ncbi:MAG TPA: hypothetical protein VM934_15765 [Pyrinomonadaceae bacterium]|nr:hypothetical protein [Pyrinomonadaceae bacterium]